MRVLVACEFSGRVRDAYLACGHDAWSCDLLPTEVAGPHIQGDVLSIIDDGWDLMIAHPPCTYLCRSGLGWMKKNPERRHLQKQAINFVMVLADAPISRIAIENPVGVLSTVWRKPDQVIQPWMFGCGEKKATCLWLKGLPILQRTHRCNDLFCDPEPLERIPRIQWMGPSKDRWKERSRTYPEIAKAMAEQWGNTSKTKP